jgi:hypothetical protein
MKICKKPSRGFRIFFRYTEGLSDMTRPILAICIAKAPKNYISLKVPRNKTSFSAQLSTDTQELYDKSNATISSQVRNQNSSLGGWVADPHVVFNLCLILKIALRKLCFNYEIILFVTALLHVQI